MAAPANPLRGIAADSAYVAAARPDPRPGPRRRPLVRRGGHQQRRDAADNVVGLVYVAAFAPDEGERLGDVAGDSKDSVLGTALVPLRYPTGTGAERRWSSRSIPAKFHAVFAADLPAEQAAVLAATQRPVAELAFSEPNGAPAWKTCPSWAVVATGDKAAGTDVVRSMAERAGAAITEVAGSHVIMISQPQAVTDVILSAVRAVGSAVGPSSTLRSPSIHRLPDRQRAPRRSADNPVLSIADLLMAQGHDVR